MLWIGDARDQVVRNLGKRLDDTDHAAGSGIRTFGCVLFAAMHGKDVHSQRIGAWCKRLREVVADQREALLFVAVISKPQFIW